MVVYLTSKWDKYVEYRITQDIRCFANFSKKQLTHQWAWDPNYYSYDLNPLYCKWDAVMKQVISM